MRRIYLDHNSTALLDDDVKKNIFLDYANPSSLHYEGRRSRNIIETVRACLLQTFSAIDSDLIFTSSGTEANNMVFHSFHDYFHIISAIEHPSVLNSALKPILVPVTSGGAINLNALEEKIEQIKTSRFVVSVMMANNEVGVVQPIKEIARLVHSYGGIIHTDAAQACGKITVDMKDLEVDMMTVSPHKFGCLIGFGALLYKNNIGLKALITGGGQEKKLRGGTENVVAISSFLSMRGKIDALVKQMDEVKVLRDTVERKIQFICPETKIFCQQELRLPNTSCIVMPGVSSDEQLMHFDLVGIAVGKGSACSLGTVGKKSHVLDAINATSSDANCALRISFGYKNTVKDAEEFVNFWEILYSKMV